MHAQLSINKFTLIVAVCAALISSAIADTKTPTASGGNPDVTVGTITGVGHFGTRRECRESKAFCTSDAQCEGEDICGPEIASFSVGTAACNSGDVPLNWCDVDTANCNEDQHPVIATNMYRLHEGRFEQIGMAWVKHGFAAVDQDGCGLECQDANTSDLLGVGCWDVYDVELNGNQNLLGPRSEINPNTGLFPYPYVLNNLALGSSIFKRLQIKTADLNSKDFDGAQYFAEAHYVTADDAAARNGNNNASHIAVNINGPGQGGTYAVNLAGSTQTEQPAIRAWKANQPSVVETDIQIADEGLFILAADATDLGDGYWRYEYALYNMNSDRAARSFSVRRPLGVDIRNVGFHDVDYHSDEPYDGTDWLTVVTSDAITFSTADYNTNDLANALRWSTLYNFRFEANAPPDTNETVAIDLFKTATPTSISATSVGPLVTQFDCNGNGIDDAQDILDGASDCNKNHSPDECDVDCDNDGTPDDCQSFADCNANNIPDDCDIDCNNTGIPDDCESFDDCNSNNVPDSCDPDCDGDMIPDDCDAEPSADADNDGVLDCDDECPFSTTVQCFCGEEVCCDFGIALCAIVVSPQACLDFGGDPQCLPFDGCRDGCIIGDGDDDGDIDLVDFQTLMLCFTGPNTNPDYQPPSAFCRDRFNFNTDGDIDLFDFANWTNNHPDP